MHAHRVICDSRHIDRRVVTVRTCCRSPCWTSAGVACASNTCSRHRPTMSLPNSIALSVRRIGRWRFSERYLFSAMSVVMQNLWPSFAFLVAISDT